MLSTAQVALFGALSAHFVNAFSPVFTSPRQCGSLKITWSESSLLDLPVVDMPLTEILMSLIPLDNDPSRIAPEPYTLSVPSGGHEIAALPFPAGTQFFATADILGVTGHVRRTLSNVFTVEHSTNTECLPTKAVRAGAKVKSFGKRQISVLGPSLVEATAAPPANAIASPSTGASTTSSSAASPSSTGGAVPPIKVIGTSNIPASGAPNVPGNAAPSPSSSGPAPPIQVIGTSYVTASGAAPPQASQSEGYSNGAYEPTGTAAESSATSTEMPMETVTTTSMHNVVVTHTATVTMTMSMDEEPCTDDNMDSMEHQTMHETRMPSETSTYMPEATQSADTAVVHYTVYDDMVNAANSWYKAWNPYKPAFTPGTGY